MSGQPDISPTAAAARDVEDLDATEGPDAVPSVSEPWVLPMRDPWMEPGFENEPPPF